MEKAGTSGEKETTAAAASGPAIEKQRMPSTDGDGESLTSVRAQVMAWDDRYGGWLPLEGGGLSTITLYQRLVVRSTSDPNDETVADTSEPVVKVEYIVRGERLEDHKATLYCQLTKDISYRQVMATFHHWQIEENKFGLKFMSRYEACEFHNRLQKAIEHLHRQTKSSSDDSNLEAEDLDDDVFVVVVWVDPLDGTLEFTEGQFDHVTVLIGVAVKGEAVGGIIHQPFYGFDDRQLEPTVWGRTIWGIVGVGAFGVTPAKPPVDKRIITTTRSHSSKTTTAAIEALQPTEIIRVGGAGYNVLLVTEGIVMAYVFASPGCKKWDTCAPDAVLTSLGGRLQYHNGVQHVNSGGVLATANGIDHGWYIDNILNEVKRALPAVIQ